ncbi:MAG TPA: hypothetical protein PLM93_11830 [Sulfuricurvum sp.]|nr:MAG: hypothetical protein B7Y30_11045 [Campylobacterales bacterium 16-40-21]OZA02050.1 MAG: hypothetical protein B7X89_11040 [Sulfuricurvum sp. 17-40-25]HQS67865.1 hypothetical protein [Sulfuricurvum sp.]HQT37265.1 hypothetical protein [Sulfuricurvum sp.]
MNPITNELILLSLFFYTLGFATLAVAGFKKSMIKWIVAYGLVVGGIVWLTELKWVLIGGIVFMLMNGFYAVWSIGRSMKQYFADIKEAKASQKRGDNNDNN